MSRTEVPAFISKEVREHRYVFFNLRPSRTAKRVVTCAGWERCAPDYVMQRDSFSYHGLEYVVKGRGTILFGKKEHSLRAGSVFAYGPQTPHRIVCDPTEPLEKYFVDFTGTEAGRLMKPLVSSPARIYQLDQPRWAREIFEQILDYGERRGPARPEVPSLQLALLVGLVQENAVPQSAITSLSYATYQRCREYLEEHFLELKSIGALAEAVHLDPAYLTRLFQRHARQNPASLLMQLKMNAAARRLKDPTLSVKEVAQITGYDDPFHFSRAFKRHWGVAPTVFAGRMGR